MVVEEIPLMFASKSVSADKLEALLNLIARKLIPHSDVDADAEKYPTWAFDYRVKRKRHKKWLGPVVALTNTDTSPNITHPIQIFLLPAKKQFASTLQSCAESLEACTRFFTSDS